MMKIAFHSIITTALIILACGVFVVCMRRSPIDGAGGASLENGIFPVCDNENDQSHPVIYGDHIVWMDERESRLSNDLYLYDMSSETESMFSNNSNGEYYPDIYGNTVVWQCMNDSFEDQILMKSFGGEMNNISCVANESENNPFIDGDWVVWTYTFDEEGDWGLDYGLVSYQISTGKTEIEPVTFDSMNDLVLSNGRIAWLDMMAADELLAARLYIYNIVTNTMELEMDVGWLHVCLTGDIVTYFNLNLYEGYELREMNLVTRQITRYYYMEEPPSEIERSGDIIVWSDARNDHSDGFFPENRDIFIFDTRNRIEAQVTSNCKMQDYPAIHGNVIVWEDERNGNPDIYGYNLTTDQNSNGRPDYLDFGMKKEAKEEHGLEDDEMWLAICLFGSCTLVACVVIIGLVMFFKRSDVPQTVTFIPQPMPSYPPPLASYPAPMQGNIQHPDPMNYQTNQQRSGQVPYAYAVDQQYHHHSASQHPQGFSDQSGQQPEHSTSPIRFCGTCGQSINYDPHSRGYYCYRCRRNFQ